MLEISGRRREAAAGVLHRLQEHCGDGIRAFEFDGLGDAVGAVAAECLLVVGIFGGCAVEVGVRYAEPTRGERLKRCLERRDSGDRQRALRRAVIGDRPRDHLVLARFSGQLEVLLGQLPGALDGLAATGGEEDAVEIARRVSGDPVGQFDGRRGGVGPQREERQCLGLLGCRLGKFLAAVAGLDDEQSGQAVEVALALVVEDVDAFAAGDDRRRDALSVPGEVPPQVPVGLGGQIGRRCLSRIGNCHRVPQLYCCLTSFK
jgi:hypothetical protein